MNAQTPSDAPLNESERAYIAALIAGKISPGDMYLDANEFTESRHEKIYEAATARLMDDKPFDVALLANDLAGSGNLALVGGASYLEDLALRGLAIDAKAADEHGQIIRAKSVTTRLQTVAAEASELSPDAAIKAFADAAEAAKLRMSVGQPVRYTDDRAIDERLGSIEWLWHPWILRGYVTTLVAPQECGKSAVALDLCGRLLSGYSWPHHSATGISAADTKLLWIDTEMALGALADRLNAWNLPRGGFVLPEDPLRLLRLDSAIDLRWIEQMVAKFRPPLIVIDALSGAHRSEEKDNDQMKLIMQWLSNLAQTHKTAVVAIHHLRKAGLGEPDWPIALDRVRGASAITQFSRIVLGLGIPNKAQLDERRMEVIKSNFGPKPEALGYQITSSGLAWGEAPDVPVAKKAIESAREFLLAELGNGPRASEEINDLARVDRICSHRTLDEAKKDLAVKSFREGGANGRWFWALPGKESFGATT